MIRRPDDLIIEKVHLLFNFIVYETIEIDLEHINQGKDGARKAELKRADVLLVIKNLVNNEVLLPSGAKDFGDESCTYFVKRGLVEGKEYKIVFCICSDRPGAIGIITLFRV